MRLYRRFASDYRGLPLFLAAAQRLPLLPNLLRAFLTPFAAAGMITMKGLQHRKRPVAT
jgi:hypothetical protein